MKKYCPHCGFEGTDEEVDEHRSTGIHNDEPQAGSNLDQRPTERLPLDEIMARARNSSLTDPTWRTDYR